MLISDEGNINSKKSRELNKHFLTIKTMSPSLQKSTITLAYLGLFQKKNLHSNPCRITAKGYQNL